MLQTEQGAPPVKKEEMKTEPEKLETEVKVIQDGGSNPIRSNMEISFEDMMQEAVPVEMIDFLQVKKKEEPKNDTQSVIIIEREPLMKYQWEIDQYNEDKRREKEDAEEEKRKKTEFKGTSKKEEEISYKKFLEKLSQVKHVTWEEMRETSRKFDERFARDIKESRLVEIFDVEEVTGDENGTRK
jgi:hypothetical protein